MKKLLLTIVLVLFLIAPAPYRITYIDGIIYNQRTGKALKIGDTVNDTDTLLMTSAKDYLSLYSKDKGRASINNLAGKSKMILEPINKSALGRKPAANEFALQVGKNLKFGVTVAKLTVRAGLITDLQDLRNYLSKFANPHQMPILVVDSLHINVNAEQFATTKDSRFFIIRYQYKGEQIDKKLNFGPLVSGELPIIINSNLYTIDQQPVTPEDCTDLQLIYYDKKKKTVTSIAPINLKIITKKALLESCNTLYPLLIEQFGTTNDSQGKIKEELYNHIAENFGLINTEDFNQLFESLK